MKRAIFSLCALLCLAGGAAWADTGWAEQRARFRAALAALENGQQEEYARLADSLKDYPLHYYLDYRVLEAGVGKGVPPAELRRFLAAYPASPLADKLRDSWLHTLGRDADWPAYLSVYRPAGNTILRCYYSQALFETGQRLGEAQEEAIKLWLSGDSRPNACNPLFEHLQQRGLLGQDLIWQRIRLAMEKDNPKLAAFLARRLDQAGQSHAALWQAVWQDPAPYLERFELPDSWLARAILRDGLRRMALKDALSAHEYWRGLGGRYAFSAEEKGRIESQIAQRAAVQDIAEALAWLRAIDPAQITEEAGLAWIRLAWQNTDWKALLGGVASLPAETRQTPQWRYWEARALEQTGQREQAHALFLELSKLRDYYGFLAADRAGAAYSIVHRPALASGEAEHALYAKYPAMLRAREFFFNEMQADARREWLSAEKLMQPAEMISAARLALQWGWHDRAVFTTAKAGAFDDLDLRFPLAYQGQILAGAQEQGLDPAWVYGIVRQESAFMHDARSHVGALGLMQLMPATGKAVAKKVGLSVSDKQDLLDLPTNIRLGSAYLRQMLDTFQGNYMLATAAYNAGPGRPRRWAAERGCLPADVWVELIPFEETRGYVRRVLEYTVVFESRLGREIKPLRLAESSVGECARPPLLLAERRVERGVFDTAQAGAPSLAALDDPAQTLETAPLPENPGEPAAMPDFQLAPLYLFTVR